MEGGGNRKDERGSLGEAVVNVQPMDKYNAAKMLVARTEREFQKRELHGGIFVSEDMDGLDPVSALGESNIISALSGIPSVISEVAGALDNMNLVTDEGKIVNIVIPKAKSGNRCRGVWKSAVGRVEVGWGKWKDVSDWLAKDFRETVGGPRGMTEKCLEFVGGKFAVMKKEGRIVEVRSRSEATRERGCGSTKIPCTNNSTDNGSLNLLGGGFLRAVMDLVEGCRRGCW